MLMQTFLIYSFLPQLPATTLASPPSISSPCPFAPAVFSEVLTYTTPTFRLGLKCHFCRENLPRTPPRLTFKTLHSPNAGCVSSTHPGFESHTCLGQGHFPLPEQEHVWHLFQELCG